jgi:hypothetical protein
METNTQKSQIEIYYPTSTATNGVPNKMISYRYDIDCWNAPRDISSATFSCESPVWVSTGTSTNLTTALPGSRCVVYARGVANRKLIQKDQGFNFVGANTGTVTAINSEFRRDNIKVLPNYTSKLMVHRVLPEVVNLGAKWNQDNEVVTTSTGQITVTIEGANSVGSTATAKTPVTLYVDADGNPGHDPWAQIGQNAFRVNTLVLSDSSTSTVWHCSATTWQIAQTEEDR